jgi:hypothetical protein
LHVDRKELSGPNGAALSTGPIQVNWA